MPTKNPVDVAKQFIDEINLPFPVVAIEIEAMTLFEQQCNDFIVIAVQDGEVVRIYTMWREFGAWNTPDSEDGLNTLSYVEINRKSFEVKMVGFGLSTKSSERKDQLVDFARVFAEKE